MSLAYLLMSGWTKDGSTGVQEGERWRERWLRKIEMKVHKIAEITTTPNYINLQKKVGTKTKQTNKQVYKKLLSQSPFAHYTPSNEVYTELVQALSITRLIQITK